MSCVVSEGIGSVSKLSSFTVSTVVVVTHCLSAFKVLTIFGLSLAKYDFVIHCRVSNSTGAYTISGKLPTTDWGSGI